MNYTFDMLGYCRVLLTVLLVLTLGNPLTYLNAQTGNEKKPVKISAAISGDTDGQNLSSLFLESLQLELGLAGFSLTDSYLADPDILIRGDYDVIGDTINFRLTAEVPGEDITLFSTRAQEEFRFALDTVLLNYARNLTESISAFVKENPDIFAADELPEGVEEAGPEPEPAEKEIVEVPLRTADTTITDEPSDKEELTKNLLLSADMGLFLAAGEAGRYMKTGFAPSFFGGYRFKPGMYGGVNLGAMYFQAEGYATEAQGFIVSFCPELRLKFDEGGSAVPGLRAAAGGAVFMVTPDGGDTETKLVPAAEAGMTMDFAFGKIVLTAAADMAFFYENGALLYGFMPRIGVNF